MSIPRKATARPVAVAMLFVAVILLGVISFFRLPIDLLPDVSYPRLVVFTSYPDVAPAEVERLVTERVEARAAAVPGVERVTSVSREGLSLVTLRFAWGTDMDFAMLNVREQLDLIRDDLPESASRPRLLRVDPESEPILSVSVAAPGGLWETREMAETVFRRRLEQLDGVAQASVTGGLEREIQVEVDPALLDAYGVTLTEITGALDAANYSAPGGTILRGRYRYPLRTLGEFQSVEEIGEVVVARQQVSGAGADGGQTSGQAGAAGTGGAEGEGAFRLVRVRDVATVVDGFAERESITRHGGQEAVGILVFKESRANTVAVADEVEGVLEQLRLEFPEIQVEVASSQAGFISDSISNVVQALVFGGILAFLVLFLFLRDPRYPVAVAVAIPISVIGTFAMMDAAGVSLNIMSLGGLALGVGMLVDNSIVVLENIFRHRELGAHPFEAAALGAEEVQGAITASTLTTISVFGPIIYVQGVAGELFRDLSLAVAFSLLASLAVALTVLPALAARFGSPATEAEPDEAVAASTPGAGFWRRVGRVVEWTMALPFRLVGFVASVGRQLFGFWMRGVGRGLTSASRPILDRFDRVFDRFTVRYHSALEWSLDHRGVVLGIAAVAMTATVGLALALERDLLPSVDQGSFEARLVLPEGTSLQSTTAAATEIEAALAVDDRVETVFTRVGTDVQSFAESEEAAGANTAILQVRLRPGVPTADVVAALRPMAARFPPGALTLESGQATALGKVLGGSESDLAVRVRGEDLEVAYAVAEEARDRLNGLEMLDNQRIAVERGTPQIQIQIRPDVAARYGIEPVQIAQAVEWYMRGNRATEYVDFDRKIGIVVRLPDAQRFDQRTLQVLRVEGIPLRELVEIRDALGPAEIHREDQGRVVVVYADVVRGGLAAAVDAVDAELAQVTLPAGIRLEVGGENEEMRRSFRDLVFAFSLALLLVYMILAAQFESLVHPMTILVSVPLALVGAVAALAITGNGINTMTLIGIVILVGIVVNDAIVKVDFINQARARGLSLRDAILQAGRVRLRPIIMTTVTTVLGLLPMALGIGRGADLRAPLAIAVIGGLLLATFLTLVVVPVVYATIEGVRVRSAESPG